MRACLGELRRRKIYGNPARRKFKVGIQDCTANPFAALPYSGFRKSHDSQLRHAVGNVGLHGYQRSFYAHQRP